jgi:putative ABC transport system permease protein
MNWLLQVLAITSFSVRTIPQRRGPSIAAVVGIAGVVAVLVGVLSIAAGFRAALTSKVGEDIAIVLRASADSESTSGLERDAVRVILDSPNVESASAELFSLINLPRRSTGTDSNVAIRGVSADASKVRGGITILEGRMFEPGRNEVIAGAGAARSFANLNVGDSFRVGTNTWNVVGVFSSGGGSEESEVWTDAAILQSAYDRGDSYNSVLVRLPTPDAFNAFKASLTSDPRLKVKVLRLSTYLADQGEMLTAFITGLGFAIASLMALGAVFGALNTMYSAVAGRTREIATLRALGFGASPIVLSVLAESLVLALIGGAIGAGLAYAAFNGYQASTINWQTFSQIAFAFAVTPPLLVAAIVWAALMGLVGGFFPALRAANIPIANALREG